MEKDALWRRVVDAKYGMGAGLPYGVCLWKSIRKGWDVFRGCVSFKV